MGISRVASSFINTERFLSRQGSNYQRDHQANRWAQVLSESQCGLQGRMVSSLKREKRGCGRSLLAPANHWSSRSCADSRAWIMSLMRSLTNQASLTTVWFFVRSLWKVINYITKFRSAIFLFSKSRNFVEFEGRFELFIVSKLPTHHSDSIFVLRIPFNLHMNSLLSNDY